MYILYIYICIYIYDDNDDDDILINHVWVFGCLPDANRCQEEVGRQQPPEWLCPKPDPEWGGPGRSVVPKNVFREDLRWKIRCKVGNSLRWEYLIISNNIYI